VPLEIPDQLHLTESFANSVDAGIAQDDLDSPERFGRWLAAHGFPGIDPDDSDLALAVGVREALRDELVAHHESYLSGEARARLDEFAARIPLRVAFRPDAPATLAPAGTGVAAMLGAVLAEMVLAEREEVWHRLKICPEETCRRVFYDKSKNRSKTWCSMQACGNRNKTRTYRDRQRELPPHPPPPPPPGGGVGGGVGARVCAPYETFEFDSKTPASSRRLA
jgi:predicted RNA-binding Zn ribbon-like protein